MMTIIKQNSSQWVYNQNISIVEASIYDVLEIKLIAFFMDIEGPRFLGFTCCQKNKHS